MKESLRTFMDGLIDYAGLFPPADLPLNEAISQYISHIKSDNSKMLSRFIIHSSKLNNLDEFLPLFTNVGPLRLSVLGGGGNNDDEYLNKIKQNITNISKYREKHGNKIEIDVIECKMATNTPSKNTMEKATVLLNENGLIHYHEFAKLPPVGMNYSTEIDDSSWDKEILPTIKLLSNLDNAGIKLRCGGIVKEAFPSVEQVAAMIQTCVIIDIPMKFTAGLHHPIRHFAEEYDEFMHGFINTFGAGIFATTFPKPENSQEKYNMFILLSHMIDDQNAENFSFTDDSMIWKVEDDRDTQFVIDVEKIENARKKGMISYGSCSFQDPIHDLTQLGWM
ncbi:MAG TPA: hypothetical protein QGI59_02980 [Candidatus Poseidoniia archaeon]|nr:hypothetical protein [Candidatus Poseidoniia archaeon]